jgi:hypothetical protein
MTAESVAFTGRSPDCSFCRYDERVQYTEVPFSWPILLTLSAIFLGSTATFFILVRRWTLNRQWTYMSEWARERRFRHRPTDEILPAPIDKIDLRPQMLISSGTITIVDFTPPLDEDQRRIHVLHRRTELPTGAGGLRPINAKVSFLDRFKLTAFPLITEGDRFTAIGVDSAAARRVANVARRLLPPDLGLLVHGEALIIDFSSRPFDVIEFDRMIALSDQLVSQFAAQK